MQMQKVKLNGSKINNKFMAKQIEVNQVKRRYELHNPSDHKVIKAFERDYLDMQDKYKKIRKNTDPVFDSYFLKEKGAIRLEKIRNVIIPANSLWNKSDKDKIHGGYKVIVINVSLMDGLTAKMKAMNELGDKRNYARQMELSEMMKGRGEIESRMSMSEWKEENLSVEETKQFENMFE